MVHEHSKMGRPKKPYYECEICGKRWAKKYWKEYHKKFHYKVFKKHYIWKWVTFLKCPYCKWEDVRFLTKNAMCKHLKQEHEEECEKGGPEDLNRHYLWRPESE